MIEVKIMIKIKKEKIVRATQKQTVECPFCKLKFNSSVMSSEGCNHLMYKASDGTVKFVYIEEED
jgi:uncharacterized protein (DUF2225 family)